MDDLRRERLVFNDLLRKLGASCDAARGSALQSLKHIFHANVARDRVRSSLPGTLPTGVQGSQGSGCRGCVRQVLPLSIRAEPQAEHGARASQACSPLIKLLHAPRALHPAQPWPARGCGQAEMAAYVCFSLHLL